ncbi:hypothetical protein HDU98_000216 [Podochytrium sp. JEL0797]|nr:hypothetical protein HDU98_000216 [Podochytrium sp. JEL0797]
MIPPYLLASLIALPILAAPAPQSSIGEYLTCDPNADSCTNPNFTCCVGPLDVDIWKYTCRETTDCSTSSSGLTQSFSDQSQTQQESQQSQNVADYVACTPNVDSCNSAALGFTCCVGPDDANAGNWFSTCRPNNNCYTTPTPAPQAEQQQQQQPQNVADYVACIPNVDSCSSAALGFTCCVGPKDASAGNWFSTCRPSNNCYEASTQSVSSFTTSCLDDKSCGYRAQFDNPPNVAGQGVVYECLTLTNYARNLYNPPAGNLVWSDYLTAFAQQSAEYSADNSCWDCHTNAGGGTSWGQNLYEGKRSCSDSYSGWVTDEASSYGGHFMNVVGFAVPYVNMGCGSSNTNGGATVCNYGLA